MFSQIDESSCFATIPLLTNSTTACDDWQSQIPAKKVSLASGLTMDILLTIASHNQEFVILIDIMYLNVWESGDYLLLGRKVGTFLELEIANRTRQGKIPVNATKIDKASSSLDTCLLG